MKILCSDREKVLHTNKVGNIVGVNIMKDKEIAKVPYENIYITFARLRSRIQSLQNRFKLIKFGYSKRRQAGKLVKYENIMVGMANILVIENNNCLLFKNNVEYI